MLNQEAIDLLHRNDFVFIVAQPRIRVDVIYRCHEYIEVKIENSHNSALSFSVKDSGAGRDNIVCIHRSSSISSTFIAPIAWRSTAVSSFSLIVSV